jgi:hypothetical protein
MFWSILSLRSFIDPKPETGDLVNPLFPRPKTVNPRPKREVHGMNLRTISPEVRFVPKVKTPRMGFEIACEPVHRDRRSLVFEVPCPRS